MQAQCILQLSIQCISGSLACSSMQLFAPLLFLSRGNRGFPQATILIAKIACRLINAPQHIRAVPMNHNQPHADSAETNCPTSVYRTLFRGTGCGYARLLCDHHGPPATLCPRLPHYVGVGLTKSDLAKIE